MKNLITAAAGLMLLMAFLLQFTHSQMIHSRLMQADRTVNVFKERVKQEGCISEENERQLKKDLSAILKCSEEEVSVSGSRVPAFRGNIVTYNVRAVFKNVIGQAGFWNISEEENRFEYKADGAASSEYTGRKV